MNRKAVDIVLLADLSVTDKAIQFNKKLIEQFGAKIVLNNENCLPHISLAMGGIYENQIGEIEKLLSTIAEQYSVGKLKIAEVGISTNSVGQEVSSFVVEKTEQLQLLHEKIMHDMTPYFHYDVSADLLYGDEYIARSTLLWINSFREKSAFDNFWPHITLGYGRISESFIPTEFIASKLALCHLGNHCTCREVIISTELND